MKRRVPYLISKMIEWRPVRWATTSGDYDGRDRTIEVFNADAPDQRRLLAQIRKGSRHLEEAFGGPLVVIFHSGKQTAERYSNFAKAFPRPQMGHLHVSPAQYVDAPNADGPHRRREVA
jgi:hypothetical protein